MKIKKHPKDSKLIMFNYHPFKSDFSHPIVRCCRGSVYIINEDGTFAPYLTPFFKFSSIGEKGQDHIDFEDSAIVTEKLDGSFIKLKKEPDGNCLWTTNRGFDLDVKIPENYPVDTVEDLLPPYTFKILLEYALRGRETEIMNLPRCWTFMFELTSPYNRIIYPYHTTVLWLLGGRDENHTEYTAEKIIDMFGLTFNTAKKYMFKNMVEVIDFCDSYDQDNLEGVVIQDKYFNRMKIKCQRYESLQKSNVRSKSFIKRLYKSKNK